MPPYALARLPISTMMSRSLSPYKAVVCAAPDYLAERGTPAHPKDLVDHDCLSYPDWRDGQRWSFSGPEGEVHVDVKSRLQINNGFGIRYAALAGAGIVHDACRARCRGYRRRAVCRPLLSDYKIQSRPRHIVWLAEPPSDAETSRLHRFCRRGLRMSLIEPRDIMRRDFSTSSIEIATITRRGLAGQPVKCGGEGAGIAEADIERDCGD